MDKPKQPRRGHVAKLAQATPNRLAFAIYYQAIGQAITHWQTVECALYVLFHCLLGASYEMSSTVFFHIKSAENRIGLIDKLCRIHFDQKTYGTEWLPLHKNFALLIKNRNALAHYEMAWLDPGQLSKENPFPIMLSASLIDYLTGLNGTRSGYSLEDINGMADDFLEMTEYLADFIFDSQRDWQERLQLLPEGHLQTLRSIRKKGSPSEPSQPDPTPPG